MTAIKDNSLKLTEAFVVLMFLFLLVSPILDATYGGLFSYTDEIVTLILVGWAISRSDPLDNHSRRAILLMVALCILGLVSNVFSQYQKNYFAVFVDLFTCMKFFAAVIAARIVLSDKGRVFASFVFIGKIFIICSLLCLGLHVAGLVNFGSGRVMFGIPCYQFLYSHPTNLAAYCVGFFALFFYTKKIQTGWIIALVLILLSTQRAKAIGMAFVVLFFVFYSSATKNDERPSIFVFAFLIAGVIAVGYDQIQEYFLNGTAARSLLASDGVDIAIDSFPLGSGFATFATYMSGEYYSPLYYYYGLNSVWGLFPANPVFVSDSFWPAVIAQFGLIGLVLVVWIMKEVYQSISMRAKAQGLRFAAYGIIPLYLLILSSSDASFFNFYGPFYALILGVIVAPQKQVAN